MTGFFASVYSGILPILLQVIAGILGVLMIRATTYASTRWGIEIEARHREALQSAILSGVTAALSRGLTGQAALDAALVYTSKSVPDALRALNPSGEVLENLAMSKLRAAVAASPVFVHQAPAPVGG